MNTSMNINNLSSPQPSDNIFSTPQQSTSLSSSPPYDASAVDPKWQGQQDRSFLFIGSKLIELVHNMPLAMMDGTGLVLRRFDSGEPGEQSWQRFAYEIAKDISKANAPTNDEDCWFIRLPTSSIEIKSRNHPPLFYQKQEMIKFLATRTTETIPGHVLMCRCRLHQDPPQAYQCVNPAHVIDHDQSVDYEFDGCRLSCQEFCHHDPKCIWTRPDDGRRLKCLDDWNTVCGGVCICGAGCFEIVPRTELMRHFDETTGIDQMTSTDKTVSMDQMSGQNQIASIDQASSINRTEGQGHVVSINEITSIDEMARGDQIGSINEMTSMDEITWEDQIASINEMAWEDPMPTIDPMVSISNIFQSASIDPMANIDYPPSIYQNANVGQGMSIEAQLARNRAEHAQIEVEMMARQTQRVEEFHREQRARLRQYLTAQMREQRQRFFG